MKNDAEKCSNVQDKKLLDIGKKVINSLNILDETASELLKMWKNNKRHAASGATPFIDMCGSIFGGWMMSKSALIASNLLLKDSNNKFLSAKIDTASFYTNTVLESSLSLKNVVINAHKDVDSILANNLKN